MSNNERKLRMFGLKFLEWIKFKSVFEYNDVH